MKILSILVILFGIFVTACGGVLLGSFGIKNLSIYLGLMIPIIIGLGVVWIGVKISHVNIWLSQGWKGIFYTLFVFACILQLLYIYIMYQAMYYGL